MRKILSVVAMVVLVGTLSAYSDVDTSFNSKQTSFHMNTFRGDEKINLSLGLEKHDGVIDSASVYLYPDFIDKSIIHVSENISGRIGITPTLTSTLNQEFYINTPALYMSEYASTGFYDANNGGGKGMAPDGTEPVIAPSLPDFWATGSTGFTGSNFSLLHSGGYYNENTYTWNNVSTTYFNGSANWDIKYPTVKLAEMAVYSVAVPEPSVLAIGSLSSLGLLARRRKQV